VRAASAGFLESASVQEGQQVAAGDVLVELSDDSRREEVARAAAALRTSEIRRDALRVRNAARAMKEEAEAPAYEAAAAKSRTQLAELQVRAPQTGRIVHCLRDSDLGTYLAQGTPVAAIASGRWEVRSILTEEQIVRSMAYVGDSAEFRAVAIPWRTIQGRITRIAPVGSRTIELWPLTHLGGGDIAVDPATRDASQPYFEVTLELLNADSLDLRHGMTGQVRLHAVAEPIGKSLGRRLTRFWNRLLEG
jgi:multidrug resistance efflux pump